MPADRLLLFDLAAGGHGYPSLYMIFRGVNAPVSGNLLSSNNSSLCIVAHPARLPVIRIKSIIRRNLTEELQNGHACDHYHYSCPEDVA
jgi:hypothetical protein